MYIHIFLFPFALDTRADGAACQSEGTEAKRVEMKEKREWRKGDEKGKKESRNEMAVDIGGEVELLGRKGRKR